MQYLVFTDSLCFGPFETKEEAERFIAEDCKQVMPIAVPYISSTGPSIPKSNVVALSKQRRDDLVRKGIIKDPSVA